eukprot:Pgem_evm1s17965
MHNNVNEPIVINSNNNKNDNSFAQFLVCDTLSDRIHLYEISDQRLLNSGTPDPNSHKLGSWFLNCIGSLKFYNCKVVKPMKIEYDFKNKILCVLCGHNNTASCRSLMAFAYYGSVDYVLTTQTAYHCSELSGEISKYGIPEYHISEDPLIDFVMDSSLRTLLCVRASGKVIK